MRNRAFIDEFAQILATAVPDQNARARKLARKLELVAIIIGFLGVIPLIAGLHDYIPSVTLRALVLLGLTAAALVGLTLLVVSKSVSRLHDEKT